MTESATVVQISGTRAHVVCDTERCEGCTSAFCALSATGFDVNISGATSVAVGDVVEVAVSASRSVLSSFITLIGPLIFFAVGYLLAGASGVRPELLRVAIGLLGIGVGFCVSLVYARSPYGRALPRVVRVVHAEPAGAVRADYEAGVGDTEG